MSKTYIEKIKPSSRILRTIGKDLIKDIHAAIIELVKNSYDADATECNIVLEYNELTKNLSISVSDNGHGMTLDTIKNIWLVPATSNKKDKKTSPGGRSFQGRKGIGRYAAGILGNTMVMDAVDEKLQKSSILLDFDDIESSEFLSEVDVLIETSKGDLKGVSIESNSIITIEELISIWNNKQLEKLKLELQKLQFPITKNIHDNFDIFLEFKNFPVCIKNCHKKFKEKVIKKISEKEKIEALPIIEYYDYRISGEIDEEGNAKLLYENQNLKIKPTEINIQVKLDENNKYCGKVNVDFRVFDRDSEAIEDLVNRGLKKYNIGKLEAKKILDDIYGVGIYRGGFRIRPYGDIDYDWLDLDKDRIQNPSFNIGMNQIVGFITIENEEKSNLFEKSARDGLVDNVNYRGLIEICKNVLSKNLQQRRFDFRQQTNRGRKTVRISEKLDSLFDFSKLEEKVNIKLNNEGVPKNVSKSINGYIQEEKKSKEKDLKDIKHTIAIYQGQVTLGKLTDVLLHEGRKSLRYINEQTPRITKWLKEIDIEDIEKKEKILSRHSSIISHSKALTNLFKRIEPLSRSKLPKKEITQVFDAINKAAEIYENLLESDDITFINNVDPQITIYGREFDLLTAFSNFIENSIHWLNKSIKDEKKFIKINSEENEEQILIEVLDNGSGIDSSYAYRIFDPGFTLKDNGTGLGLSLAAEALNRSEGKVSVIDSKDGFLLNIEFKKGNNNYE